jgi:hypothetical protein
MSSEDAFTFQIVKWIPSGSELILVHNNDIYHKPNPKEKKIQRLTFNGQPGVIYNGIPDWVYEGNSDLSSQYFLNLLPQQIKFWARMSNQRLNEDYYTFNYLYSQSRDIL